MSENPQPGGPFGFGAFDLGEMMKMLSSEGPLNLEVARQVAGWVATQESASDGEGGGATARPALAASDAGMFDELVRTAQIHVQEATGLGSELDIHPRVLGRREWALDALDGLGPVLTALAERIGATAGPTDGPGETPIPGFPDLGSLMGAMAPLLLGVQAGFMVGHLSTIVLSTYEMPLPLAGRPAVVFVGDNAAAFEADWDLPPDQFRFSLALHEVLHAAMRSVDWVQGRVMRLANEYVSAFDVDPGAVEERLAAVDPTDPASLESALGDPAEFLHSVRSPGQQQVLERLRDTVAVLEGFADVVMAHVGSPLLPDFTRIREAAHRHRVERGEAARFLEALLGFDVGRSDYERAGAFWRGVLERCGEEGLALLWEREEHFPTPPELDAPGLWLERLALPPRS